MTDRSALRCPLPLPFLMKEGGSGETPVAATRDDERTTGIEMERQSLLIVAVFIGLSLWLPIPVAAKNVVLMISDNHCWFDAGCYGNDVVQTPNIDRLAADGVRFEHAFATTASCGPSRAVIYSGLLTHRNGQYAHPHREHNQQIRPDVTTIFAMLKQNGYRTALIGKDHIRPESQYPIDFKPQVNSRDVRRIGELAKEFIDASDKPFFLVVSFGDPHPISIDGVAWGIQDNVDAYEPVKYAVEQIMVPGFLPDTEDVREGIAGYYQQISRMDHGVGLVLEALKDQHREDTLVMFTADHGTSEPGAMGTHYEPGVRVPFVVRKPGNRRPGFKNTSMITFADIAPTILDWTSTEFEQYKLHGRSFLAILDSPQPVGWDFALLSHVGHDVFAYYPMRTLRGRRYKLIWNITYQAEFPLPIDTVQRRTWRAARSSESQMLGRRTIDAFLHRPQLELYDLQKDPWETNNLAGDPSTRLILDNMVDDLVRRLESQQDPWLRNYHPRKPGQ